MNSLKQQDLTGITDDHKLLEAMMLPMPFLLEVVATIVQANRSVHPLAPASYKGSGIWGLGSALIRERLLPLGWEVKSHRNDEQIINRTLAASITVKRGDKHTGLPGCPVSQKSPAGELIQEAVIQNGQLLLFPHDTPPESLQRWFLLVYDDGLNARAEFSLPITLSGNYRRFEKFARRIIIPIEAYMMDDVILLNPDETQDDFEIKVKKSG